MGLIFGLFAVVNKNASPSVKSLLDKKESLGKLMPNEQQEECFLKLKWMKLGPGPANYRSASVFRICP